MKELYLIEFEDLLSQHPDGNPDDLFALAMQNVLDKLNDSADNEREREKESRE